MEATKGNLDCDGLSDSVISGIMFDNVTVTGKGTRAAATCRECVIDARASAPEPRCSHGESRKS